MPAVTLITATLRYTPEPASPWPTINLPHRSADYVGSAKSIQPETAVITATVAAEGSVAASVAITGTPGGEYARDVTMWFTDGDELPEFAVELAEHAKAAVVRAAAEVVAA